MRSNQALVTLFTSCFAFLFLLAQVTSHVPVTQWIPVLLAAVLLWEHLIVACGVQIGHDAIREAHHLPLQRSDPPPHEHGFRPVNLVTRIIFACPVCGRSWRAALPLRLLDLLMPLVFYAACVLLTRTIPEAEIPRRIVSVLMNAFIAYGVCAWAARRLLCRLLRRIHDRIGLVGREISLFTADGR